MMLTKLAGPILIAATVLSCASVPKSTPQQSTEASPDSASPELTSPALASPNLTMPKQDPELITDGRDIEAVQRILNQLGYNAGKIDGNIGANTRQAIRAFQKDRSMVENGRPTLALAAKLRAEISTVVGPGDLLIYSDGKTELVAVEREVQWAKGDSHILVAIRPPMTGWPSAARTGLDWAITHALDDPASPVKWSSTGVDEGFEVYASRLTPREAAVVGEDAQSCRHFELRSVQLHSRFPAIACSDANGWYITHSTIRLARPATGLGSAMVSDAR